MLGRLESGKRAVIADMEAGAGVLTRMAEGSLDLALIVTEPSAKSIEVARRASEIISERKIGPTLVIANRVRGSEDAELIRSSLRAEELVAIPEDPAVSRADRDGVSPFDAAPDAPAVEALVRLAGRLATTSSPRIVAGGGQAGG